MNKILVPTDFSNCADKALSFATTIAQKAQAGIVLLHAGSLHQNELGGDDDVTDGKTTSSTKNEAVKLQALKQQVEQKHKVAVTTRLLDGPIAGSIQKTVDEYQADLVVMGTQGATGLKKMIMGSNTAATINKTSKPVLTIPDQYNGAAIDEMLLAINQTEDNLNCLEIVFELARHFNAQVRLVIFTGGNDEAATYIDDRRTITGIQYKLKDLYGQDLEAEHLTGSDFQETLQRYIEEKGINLLVMITHKRSVMEGLFNKSMTRKMVYHTTIPLLSIHQ